MGRAELLIARRSRRTAESRRCLCSLQGRELSTRGAGTQDPRSDEEDVDVRVVHVLNDLCRLPVSALRLIRAQVDELVRNHMLRASALAVADPERSTNRQG